MVPRWAKFWIKKRRVEFWTKKRIYFIKYLLINYLKKRCFKPEIIRDAIFALTIFLLELITFIPNPSKILKASGLRAHISTKSTRTKKIMRSAYLP